MVSQLGVPFIPKTTNQLSEVAGYEFKGGTMRVTVDNTSSLSLSTMQQTIYDTILSHSTAQIDFSMTATQLIKSGDKVTGVMATDADGNVVEYDAAKGVILAAGGFGANADMKNDLLTHITDCFQDGRDEWGMAMDQDGAGISMGVWAGGRLEPRPLANMNGDFAKGSFPQAIWLDENGKRYCNEYFGDVTLAGKPQARMAHVWLWSICDSRLPEYSDYCIPAHDAYEPATDAATRAATFAAAIGTGSEGYTEVVAGPPGAPVTEPDPNDPPTCYCGNTIDELIANAGWDAAYGANVKASVEHWNALRAEKKDEDFGKDPEVMFPIETGPFYAFSYDASAVGGLMVTLGGLLTDKNQEVLDEQCEPIPGLYATGNCCGRRFGYGYFTQVCGESLGMAIVLGRQLGKYLAAL